MCCAANKLVLSAFLALCLAAIAFTQTTSSEVSGTVVDPSAAVVARVKVTLLNHETSEARTVTTNESGVFVFPAVVRGTYSIKVEATGFKTQQQMGIVITANEKRSVGSITLALGSASESVTVEAHGAQVQTSSGENASLLSNKQLDLLSTRGRDVVSLLKLIPGVTPGADAESLGGTFGTALPAVNGQSSGFNQMTLDGQSGTDDDITGTFNETTSMDAIAEVRVLMNNYQAEYGRNASAVINLISKSGSNEFHGSAYWYKRHEEFNANNFFNNRQGLPKPLYRYNIFGGTLGGPIFIPRKFNSSRSKLFFFYSREDQRTFTPQNPGTVTMPTQLERNGDFSQTLDVSGKLIPIRDPLTGNPFPNNIIPADRIDKNGQALLNIFKLPNFLDRTISGGNYNYQWQQAAEVPKKQNLLKVDYNPTSKDRFSVRARDWWADTRQFNIFGTVQANWDLLRSHYLFTEKSVETTWTRVLTASMVNELAVSFRALHESSPKQFASQWDPITRNARGLSGLGQWNPAQNPDNIIPQLSFGGVPNAANMAVDVLNRLPIDARDFRYTALDNLSVNKGAHSLKFGYYYEFNVSSEGPRGNVFGSFNFGKDVNNALDTNYAYSNALLGNFTSYTEASNKTRARNFYSLTEWFAQDSWKASRRLTLELGIRFSYAPPNRFPDGDAAAFFPALYNPKNAPVLIQPTISNGKRVGLNPVTGALMPTPTIGFYAPGSGDPLNGLRSASQVGYSFNDGSDGVRLAPRLGFAWDVFGTGKTAVRGGMGITRNPLLSTGRYSNAVNITPPAQYNPTQYYGTLSTFTSIGGLLSAPGSIPTYGPDMKVTTLYSWSLFVQQDLGHAFIANLGYVGNQGRHIGQTQDMNLLPYGTRFLASSADPTNGGLPLPDVFLRPYPGYSTIVHYENNGIANYNALQASLNRRFTKGFQFGTSYTWSKAMSNGTNIPTFLNVRTWNYGKTGDDRTHVLVLNFTYDLPKLSKALPNPVVHHVFDNWQVSGIGTFASGAPSGLSFSTVSGADLTGGGDGQRVVLTAPIAVGAGDRSFGRWFNTQGVAVPAKGQTGNAPVDVFRGPGTNNWDLTAFKSFPLGKESRVFQLRWELYNAFNHTQWSAVNTAARFDATGAQVNALFGTVTAARGARVMQGSLRFQF